MTDPSSLGASTPEQDDALVTSAYDLASWAVSSDLSNTPEFLAGLNARIDAIDRLLMRQCDQCGWEPSDGWISQRCGSHPFGSCDGTLRVMRRTLAASPSPPVTQEPCEGGVTARWCPKCGSCTCPSQDGNPDRWVENPACPIHGTVSTHATPPSPAPSVTCEWRTDSICPSCGEDVTDSPEGDLPVRGSALIECQNCGESVTVEARRTIEYRLTPLSLSSGGTK